MWHGLWRKPKNQASDAHQHLNDPASLYPESASTAPQAEQLFSLAALHRAWLAVKRADGGPGVDKVTLSQFEHKLEEELAILQQDLVSGSYRPRPLRQIVVPKAGQGLRNLLIWAIRDRIAQRVVYDLLTPSFERIFLPCSFGFRPGRNVQDAVTLALHYRDQNYRWVVHADVKDCFDRIDHKRLYGLVRGRVHNRQLLRYIHGWLNANIFNSADGLPKKAGTGQGGVLSPLFANIYLHEFDQRLVEQQWALVRYADDFIICCRRKNEAETAHQFAAQVLAHLGLSYNKDKSRIVHFDQGFPWLGHFFIRRQCYPLSGT